MNRKWIMAGSILCALLLAISAARATSATSAVTFTVNSTDDVVDANPGDGMCETAPGNGICTLRAATMEANRTSGATIRIPAGTYYLTIVRHAGNSDASGALAIASAMTLVGAGAAGTIIDGNGSIIQESVLRVINWGIAIAISGVTIRNGLDINAANGIGGYGGGISNGNGGVLTLNDSVVTLNTGLFGGGIFNANTLTLNNTAVSTNTATAPYSANGLNRAGGGGIVNELGTVVLNNSTVINNASTASTGGGIATLGGKLVVVSSIVSTNTAYYVGGGIYIDWGASVTVSVSKLNGNIAAAGGGVGIENGVAIFTRDTIGFNAATYGGGGGAATDISGTLTLADSTVSDNTSEGDGGGIQNTGSLTLYDVTIADNEAGYAAGHGNTGRVGGGILNTAGTVNFRNSLLGYNAHYISSLPFFAYDDCFGSLTSQGYNLIYTTTNCIVGGIGMGNKLNVDPKLDGALKFNGGPTPTHALLAGSPAIDAGNLAGCTDNLGAPLTTDQRGFPRVDGDGNGSVICDIGAYEYGSILRLWLPLIRR